MTIYFIIIIIFIFIFFFIINNFILNKSYEKFEKMKNGLLCGTNNDICRINEYGISSCCDKYRCVRPEGIYKYKICVDKNKLINSDLSTNTNINIPTINIKKPDIKFPSIKSINLPNVNNIPIFTKDYWKNMFDFNFCPVRKKKLS
jgi:hypothetical protein